MKTIIKFISFITVLAFLVLAVVACSGEDENTASESSSPAEASSVKAPSSNNSSEKAPASSTEELEIGSIGSLIEIEW